ncbi:MAG: 30S ribosomal protein S16 [Acidobacteria bacterium]|nr:30S ribosomal protein S16 [Acidobacteriota bacterium]
MVMIRMRRAGSKNRAFFRIVVTESAAARDGRFIEILGHYNPRTTPETLVIDRERYAHWLSTGATPSDTLRTLISRAPVAPATDSADSTEPVALAVPVAPETQVAPASPTDDAAAL